MKKMRSSPSCEETTVGPSQPGAFQLGPSQPSASGQSTAKEVYMEGMDVVDNGVDVGLLDADDLLDVDLLDADDLLDVDLLDADDLLDVDLLDADDLLDVDLLDLFDGDLTEGNLSDDLEDKLPAEDSFSDHEGLGDLGELLREDEQDDLGDYDSSEEWALDEDSLEVPSEEEVAAGLSALEELVGVPNSGDLLEGDDLFEGDDLLEGGNLFEGGGLLQVGHPLEGGGLLHEVLSGPLESVILDLF